MCKLTEQRSPVQGRLHVGPSTEAMTMNQDEVPNLRIQFMDHTSESVPSKLKALISQFLRWKQRCGYIKIPWEVKFVSNENCVQNIACSIQPKIGLHEVVAKILLFFMRSRLTNVYHLTFSYIWHAEITQNRNNFENLVKKSEFTLNQSV